MHYTAHYDSPLGGITMSSDDAALTGLWFDEQKHFASTLPSEHSDRPDHPVFEATRRWLDTYFSGRIPQEAPPLALHGSAFQRRVWRILLTIPYGKTMSYGEIARQIAEDTGAPTMSAQAVGGAVGRNPISLIVPCHRVIGSNGQLTGYAGGIERKQWMLEMEGKNLPLKGE